jgi:hypothetical protein
MDPDGQLVHDVSERVAAYLLTSQFNKHSDNDFAPARLVLPEGQVVQTEAPAREYVATAHWVTVVLVQNEPAGHCVQVTVAPCNSW